MVNNKVILTPELKITNKITADTDIENFDINEFEYNLNSKINNKDISSKKTANQSKTSNSILELYDFDADEIINLPILNSYTTDFDYKKEYNNLKIENNNNAKFNLKKTIFIKKEIETNRTINENTNNNTNEKFNEYLLALSNFDSDDISVLNQNVLDLATAALINDKKVEITGMNDQIGSVERNASLSKNRAIKGQNLIQKNIEKYLKKDNKNSTTKDLQKISNNIQIINFDDFYFSNENPYGRTLNRGIMVKIYK
jgi:outer membrane protein OmpA-like peptidoglycan-associated protein